MQDEPQDAVVREGPTGLTRLTNSYPSRVDVAEIEEECPHSEQFAGMCTNCGKDMTM